MPSYTHPKWEYHLAEDFDVYQYARNKLHHSLFSYHVTFQRILQFDWMTAFWPITRDRKFCQMSWWNINNNISFHFRLFPRKITWQKFSKNPKKPILGPFCPILGKNKFSWKKGLCQLLNILIIYHCAKNQFNLIRHSWENSWTETPKTSLFHQFLREIQPVCESCDWLKNPTVWLAKSILGHISETRFFSNMKFVQAYSNYNNTKFRYRPNWEKIKELKEKTFLNIQKILGLAYFPHFWGKTLFSKHLAESCTTRHGPLITCWVP